MLKKYLFLANGFGLGWLMDRPVAASVSRTVRVTGRLAVLGLFGPMLLAGGSVQVSAQDPTSEEQEADFFEIVEVEVVNIDVVVTDKKGDPVEGLTKEDFIVKRDGAEIEVANFYAVANGRTVETVAEPLASSAPSATELPTLAGGIAPEHKLWLVIYLDNYNSDPIERNRVLPALRQFLGRTLRYGDQAMIVSYDRALEVQQPFTDDLDLLFSTLEEAVDKSGLAPLRDRSRTATLQQIDEARSAEQALLYARHYAEEQMNNVDFTLRALGRLVDSLGGLPGRKALVHVSSGIAMTSGEEAFHAVGERFGSSEAYGEIPRHDTSRRFERVNRQANAHRVSFYTVDAGGLKGLEFGAAEYAGFVDQRLRRVLDSVVPENLQAPLRLMALDTGGRAIVNQNEIFPALSKVADGFRSFYSLGITAEGADVGRYHSVDVKLRGPRKGYKIRHRSGYRSKNIDSRARERLLSALLYETIDQEQQEGPSKVRWGRLEKSTGERNYTLPIQLRVPLEQVVLLPTVAGKHEARLRMYVAAVGVEGERSEIETAPFGVRLEDQYVEAAKKESLLHGHTLLLSPGRKKVGVAILDVFGRETWITTRSFLVGTSDVQVPRSP